MRISVEDYNEAMEWLGSNKDKWKMPIGKAVTELLVPVDEVPASVIAYIQFQKENDDLLEQEYEAAEALGLN